MGTPTNALPAGTVIKSKNNLYTILNVLGSGGFGITYLASVDTIAAGVPAKALVAIKEHFLSNECQRDTRSLSVSYSDSSTPRVSNSLKDFLAEARHLNRLAGKHSNIVNVSEVFEANNTAYYVMEYLHGESLRKHVKDNGKLTIDQTMELMLPVIDAAAFLHVNNITHLDIKPANIMLVQTPKGLRPVLIDFGLSKHYNADGSATATINTLGFSDGYSPIEQYVGITQFSPTADVYALAATIIFCLSGETPPKADRLTKQVAESLLPADTPDILRETIIKATSMRIADRFSNACGMYDRLAYRSTQNRPQTIDATTVYTTENDIYEFNDTAADNDIQFDIPLCIDMTDHDNNTDQKQLTKKGRQTDRQKRTASYGSGRFKRILLAIGTVAIAAAIGAGGWYLFSNVI